MLIDIFLSVVMCVIFCVEYCCECWCNGLGWICEIVCVFDIDDW